MNYDDNKVQAATIGGGIRPPSPMMESAAKEARQRTWDECPLEEKVERLRRVLMNLQHTQQYVSRSASSAKDIAENHQHNPATGEVLQSVRRHGGMAEGGGSSFDPLR